MAKYAKNTKFERYPTTNINPILVKERSKATFNPELVTHLLDGGDGLTKHRRDIERLVLEDKYLMEDTDYSFLSRTERYEAAVRKEGYVQKKYEELGITSQADKYFYGCAKIGMHLPPTSRSETHVRRLIFSLDNLVHPNEASPFSLHGGMVIPAIENQATEEQKEKWLRGPDSKEMIATYAQTELGHGTYVRGLETIATYDPATEEFILDSPTLTATKWWPGGLGKTSNTAIVMALLYTKGVCHGMHPFMVKLRDYNTHKPLPGIHLGDIGPKFGFDSVDNGFLRFDKFRIPRENLLMKNQQVLKDGTYVRTAKNEKLAYGAMIFIRAMVVLDQGARLLGEATTIAIRYSCIRHQSEMKPGAPEPQVIEYKTQQYRLFPLLATAYAYYFAGLKIRETYFMLNYEIQRGNLESLPELHATSSGLKALSTSTTMHGVEQCRLACGGHGYSLASGIPKIYVAATAACTYEGENFVLYLQTARYLVKAYQQAHGKSADTTAVPYLTEKLNSKSSITAALSAESLIEAYKHKAIRLIARAVEKLTKLQSQGKEYHDAWNMSAVELVKAAQAHCLVYVVETFHERMSYAFDDNVIKVLTQLFQLFACYGISESAADFIEDGYVSTQQLELIREAIHRLMDEIRPNAIALTDAFDFSDRLLGSVLGRYDGNVYENLYKWASASPLNKTDVHESIKHVKPNLQSKL